MVSAGVLLVAHEIGRIPPVRQFFGSVFRDTIPLDDIPEDVPDEEVKVKVAEYTQPSSIRYTLAFLSGLELTVWTVVFGSSLGLVLNTDGEDVAFKRNTKFAGAMVLVWVSCLGLCSPPPLTLSSASSPTSPSAAPSQSRGQPC